MVPVSDMRDYARRFLAEQAAGPKAGPAGGGAAGRPLALPAPDGMTPGEAPSVNLLDELRDRFDALLRQLEVDARRDGLHDDGPMTRVLQMLQLCMGILREVTDLNIRTTERHADQVVGTIEGAERQAKAVVEWARADLARQMATEHTQFADHIAGRVVSQTERGIERRARQFPVKVALWLAVVLFGSNAITAWVVHDRTVAEIAVATAAAGDAGIKGTLAAIHETEAGLRDAFRTESLGDAMQWLDLMRWNSIPLSLARCKEPELSFVGAGGRHACKVPLWTEAPVPTQAPPPAEKQQTKPEPQPQPQSKPQPKPWFRINPLRLDR